MKKITELHIRKLVREVLSEALILEISAEEKTKVMDKSNERVPFNVDLMKQAIEQGREVGMLFRTDNEKTRMPVAKYRIIHPVAIGRNRKGEVVFRGLHITGQSEKKARETGVRSAEAEAEKDGMNAWRLFKASNARSMWFTDRFFSDNMPGFNPNDKDITSMMAVYNPAKAKAYQDSLVAQMEKPAEEPTEIPIEPTPQSEPTQAPVDKDIEQMGYENQPIQEKNKRVRNLFK